MPDAESLISELYRAQQTGDISYEDFYESLYQFYLTPLDLNTASPDELRSLFILNDVQIAEIGNHIKAYGPFVSVNELQTLPGFQTELIRKVMPFITIRPAEESWGNLKEQIKKPDQHYLLLRSTVDMEEAKGYKRVDGNPPAYTGGPQNFYLRYRIQKYKAYSAGITAEKDGGESFGFDPGKNKYGADFLSFHAMVYNKGRIKRIILGDYQLQFGQGLIVSGGFFTGKGSETVLSVRRSSTGIRPFTSLLETSYLRGASASLAFGRFEVTPFMSVKFTDGSVSSDTVSDKQSGVLQYSGLHRTKSELNSRAAVKEQLAGCNIQYQSPGKNFQTGIHGMYIDYNRQIQSSGRFYNTHSFKGSRNTNSGIYYSYLYKNLSFFGEAGLTSGNGKGLIQGLLLALGPKVDMAIVYRNYTPAFYAPYGNSFGENYKNTNENGFYWGLKLKPTLKTEITGYYDFYRFPWLKYRVSAPSAGSEYLLSLRHKFSKKIMLFVQFREELKEKDTQINTTELALDVHKRRNASLVFEYKADQHLYLKSRVQGSTYSYSGKLTQGYFIGQDIGYDGKKFDISFRAALFDTDDFENRQYAFENDVLYAFSIPFFSGQGMRNYVVTRINITKNMALWVKYGRTTYFDRQTTGTGNEEVNGNVKSELRAEIRYLL